MENQLTLFSKTEATANSINIEGLNYIEEYISEIEEINLINKIDENEWSNELSRRVQHYGYKYDYKTRRINEKMKIGEIPDWLEKFCRRLFEDKYFEEVPDQVIINEYEPGQGIASHIDCEPCFKETIVSLSLNSDCLMLFTKKFDIKNKKELYLRRRSIIFLSDDARYEWLHGIEKRKNDKVNGIELPRKRRVSLTFRKVILSDEMKCKV